MRLSFVILSFIASFFLVAHGLSFIGASKIDADGGASIVALVSAAFAMYGWRHRGQHARCPLRAKTTAPVDIYRMNRINYCKETK